MTSDIQIIDNFLSEYDFNNIKTFMLSNEFNWHYLDGINLKEDNNFQFTHLFYSENFGGKPVSSHFNVLFPILKKLSPFTLLRVKANLITKSSKIEEHGFHKDFEDSRITTAVFYLNNNNGYTLFENKTKVESVENRICIFPATISHSGSSCTDSKIRAVINFNYIREEN